MGGLHEGSQVIVFECLPFRIDLPEHDTAKSFRQLDAAGERGGAVGTAEGLKGVAQFMGDHAVGPVVDACGRRPEGSDFVVDAATEGRAAVFAAGMTKKRNLYLVARDLSLSTHLRVST